MCDSHRNEMYVIRLIYISFRNVWSFFSSASLLVVMFVSVWNFYVFVVFIVIAAYAHFLPFVFIQFLCIQKQNMCHELAHVKSYFGCISHAAYASDIHCEMSNRMKLSKLLRTAWNKGQTDIMHQWRSESLYANFFWTLTND